MQSSINGPEIVTDEQPVPLALTFTQAEDPALQLNSLFSLLLKKEWLALELSKARLDTGAWSSLG